MSYFRYIDNGEGPTKLFIGGIHGNEGVTSLKFLKRINTEDLSYPVGNSIFITSIKLHIYQQSNGNIMNLSLERKSWI